MTYYRFQEIAYSDKQLMLVKYEFPVTKETPQGVWIDYYGTKRYVKNEARKRFACPTVEEALASYHARKKRQISILKHQLRRAEAALTLSTDKMSASFLDYEL